MLYKACLAEAPEIRRSQSWKAAEWSSYPSRGGTAFSTVPVPGGWPPLKESLCLFVCAVPPIRGQPRLLALPLSLNRILFPCSCFSPALILSPQSGMNSPNLRPCPFLGSFLILQGPAPLATISVAPSQMNFPLCCHMPLPVLSSQFQSSFLAFLLAADVPARLLAGKVDLATT